MSIAGGNQTRITNDPAYDADYASWSPDSARLVFASTRHGAKREIYAVDSDGSNLVRLTNFLDEDDVYPAWGP